MYLGTMVCMHRTTRLGGKALSDEERESALAARQVEEQAYQTAHSRDFEGLASGTRTVCRRIVRTVGEVRSRAWVRAANWC